MTLAHADPVIGVHDPTGDAYSEVIAVTAKDVVSIPSGSSSDFRDTAETYLIDKDLLLQRSTHIIVVVNDIASLSILTGAVRKLLNGSIRGILVISPFPVMELLELAALPREHIMLRKYIMEGRFLVTQKISLASINGFLASVE